MLPSCARAPTRIVWVVGEMALLFRKASAVARETPILFISRPRFIRRSSVGLLSRNTSVSDAGPIGGRERRAADRGHPEVHGEFSQKRRPGDLVQLFLEDFVRTVGVDPELDGEVAFGFGESGHVLDGVAFRRSGLAASRGFLHGLSRLIEEAPNALRNAGDRGYGIGDQIPGDIERDFSRLLRGLRELLG